MGSARSCHAQAPTLRWSPHKFEKTRKLPANTYAFKSSAKCRAFANSIIHLTFERQIRRHVSERKRREKQQSNQD